MANLAKGLFSAFSDPAAHEPRVEWALTEQDAIDVPETLPMIHGRMDHATLARMTNLGCATRQLAPQLGTSNVLLGGAATK